MRTAREIRAYIEAATKGPWVTGPEGLYWPIVKKCEYQDLLATDAGNAEADATFCVNARDDLPRLLDVAQRLRKALVLAHSTRYEEIVVPLLADTVWLDGDDEPT